MGTKGARTKTASVDAAQRLLSTLEPLGDVTARAMFGGHGIFKDDIMFAIVDSEGRIYLRADGTTAQAFESAGSTQHARMPYWEVPGPILENNEQLREWSATAAEVATTGRR